MEIHTRCDMILTVMAVPLLFCAKGGNAQNAPMEFSAAQPAVQIAASASHTSDTGKTSQNSSGQTAKRPKSVAAPVWPAPGSMPLAVLPSALPDGKFYFGGSIRSRIEDWNWWPTDRANGAYTFDGTAIRMGVSRSTRLSDFVLDLELPILAGLPTRASAPAPQGALGQGANYYDANHGQVASLFPRQLYFRLKNFDRSGDSLRLGRFEFSDGLEIVAPDPTLNYLKQNRISQRLIGPFNFTDVGRSFDGLHFVNSKPNANVTVLAAFPTRGAFSLRGGDTLTSIQLGYGAVTFPNHTAHSASEARLFAVYYGDNRGGQVVKTDNRTLAARTADTSGIHITTAGGNYLASGKLGTGRVDGLLWGAGQFGNWGLLNQGAFAFAAEAGYQPGGMRWHPWLRFGFDYYSGDGNGKNGQHGTFIPVLPTARTYARDPFFTEANLQDLFAQIILRPSNHLTLRSDLHALSLADSHDLWYSGGGAYEDRNFGYAGRPSNGHGDLATLVDLSADYQIQKATTLSFYFAYANGGNVISSIFKSRDSLYGYAEIAHRF